MWSPESWDACEMMFFCLTTQVVYGANRMPGRRVGGVARGLLDTKLTRGAQEGTLCQEQAGLIVFQLRR